VLNNLQHHYCHQVCQKVAGEKNTNARKKGNGYYKKSSMVFEQVPNCQYQPLIKPNTAREVMML